MRTRNEREADLKTRFTPENLALIVEAAKVCGWSVDYIELHQFVQWCYDLAGVQVPDLEPYPDLTNE